MGGAVATSGWAASRYALATAHPRRNARKIANRGDQEEERAQHIQGAASVAEGGSRRQDKRVERVSHLGDEGRWVRIEVIALVVITPIPY